MRPYLYKLNRKLATWWIILCRTFYIGKERSGFCADCGMERTAFRYPCGPFFCNDHMWCGSCNPYGIDMWNYMLKMPLVKPKCRHNHA